MNKENIEKIFVAILIIAMLGIIFFFQTQKIGFHEDEIYTSISSVNPLNGLMWAYGEPWENKVPIWLSRQYVTDFITLSKDNYLNLHSVYQNQEYDNHPPFFYTLVHFSSMLFGGEFTKYNVFIVNAISFILSCLVIRKIFQVLGKDKLQYAGLILYGLSMGTISMVLFQRMYMLLTFFILLYLYYTLKIYKNNFVFGKKDMIFLGLTTVLGFLTQYFFAIYAVFLFALMVIQMVRKKADKKNILLYIGCHIIYAVVGILLFTPCINHLLYSDRGISNLGNGEFFTHCWQYVKHLAYAFSIDGSNTVLTAIILVIFVGLIVYLFKKSNEKFTVSLLVIPSVLYFFIAVKMTSFQELRYVMPMIPFIVLLIILILDSLKLREIAIAVISCLLVLVGFVVSKPLFLYSGYQQCLDMAEENRDKSFVYVYDNFFCHMQSVPEMMIYEKSLIINVNEDELKYIIDNEELNNEDAYILCIKNYMDNDSIISQIKENTDFKNIEKIYEAPSSHYEVENNLYLVSK